MANIELLQPKVRRARNSLTQDAILDAARELVSEHKELSIRALSTELACTPMALYRHFANKESIQLALLDRVLEEIVLEVSGGTNLDQFLAISIRHLHVLQENPWSIELLFANPSPGPSAARVGERFIELLLLMGFSEEEAANLFSGVLALNYGWAGFTADREGVDFESRLIRSVIQKHVSDEEFPATTKVFPYFSKIGTDESYLRMVNGLLVGQIQT